MKGMYRCYGQMRTVVIPLKKFLIRPSYVITFEPGLALILAFVCVTHDVLWIRGV